MEPVVLLDAAGRRRSAATMPGHRRGQPPRNKGLRYPPIRRTSRRSCWSCAMPVIVRTGWRMRGLIVVMWRAGLRISEALAFTESDLDVGRGAILVRHGKGDKRREVGMDQWGWELLRPWLSYRVQERHSSGGRPLAWRRRRSLGRSLSLVRWPQIRNAESRNGYRQIRGVKTVPAPCRYRTRHPRGGEHLRPVRFVSRRAAPTATLAHP